MIPKPLLPRIPSATASRSGPADRHLLQERLRLFASIAFLIAAAFYVVGQLLARLAVDRVWSVTGHAGLLTILVLLAGTWLYCRKDAHSAGVLQALDAILIVSLSLLLLVMTGGTIAEADLRGMVMLLQANLVLNTRAILVPSSGPRTLVLSALASLPLMAYSLATESARFSAWKLMWLLAAIAVATAGSSVIYGLRRDVRHAQQLGQYTLEEKLGEGGMGVVYRARHALLRRPTAVKLLRPGRVGEANLRRFEREVQLTAGLSHPNTVSVFDYGRTPDGVFYYAMEYLDGLTLDEVVAGDGPQPPARVVHVLRQVLGALGEAHGIGLVHRDVKPGNVILCERGGVPDVAKVLDFGLVKELDGGVAVSQEGALVGTPLYLAPEAIRAPGADARADLYSLGAVAYLLLAGRHVFAGDSVIEICSHHLHTPPEPPSRKLGHALPPALEQWVLSCLEKDPALRPRSAADAASRLDDAVAGATWSAEDARAWWAGKGRTLVSLRHAGTTVAHDAATLSHPRLTAADDPGEHSRASSD